MTSPKQSISIYDLTNLQYINSIASLILSHEVYNLTKLNYLATPNHQSASQDQQIDLAN